ncbi:hypothetical protein FAI40_01625 [Acetobacteraceae bacterium]|nr:hypothetical protein FAI40_01625 [Acetobacteraceae bacterium]
MMKKLFFLSLSFFLCAASPAISFNYEELQTDQLEKKALDLASDCIVAIQSEKPTKHDKKACKEFDKINAILKEQRSVCWGPNDVINAEKHWLPCSDPKSENFQW